MKKNINQLRIIAGQWRGRKINFPNIANIRPTPDRVRETLFNWLAPYVVDACCLDAFAGSGALSFEALSRGAKSVIAIDQAPTVIQALQENAAILKAENLAILAGRFPEILLTIKPQKFDIIFLDPPFKQNLIAPSLQALIENNLLADKALIYIEAEKELTALPIPAAWQIFRSKIAGQVGYHLILSRH